MKYWNQAARKKRSPPPVAPKKVRPISLPANYLNFVSSFSTIQSHKKNPIMQINAQKKINSPARPTRSRIY